VARALDEDELVGNWTLVGDELDRLSGRPSPLPTPVPRVGWDRGSPLYRPPGQARGRGRGRRGGGGRG